MGLPSPVTNALSPMPVLRVALDLPLHTLFDYLSEEGGPADVGLRVRVPFGRGERIGIIVEVVAASEMPACAGAQGPGEMTSSAGAMRAISAMLIASLRKTRTSCPSSPKYCTRL